MEFNTLYKEIIQLKLWRKPKNVAAEIVAVYFFVCVNAWFQRALFVLKFVQITPKLQSKKNNKMTWGTWRWFISIRNLQLKIMMLTLGIKPFIHTEMSLRISICPFWKKISASFKFLIVIELQFSGNSCYLSFFTISISQVDFVTKPIKIIVPVQNKTSITLLSVWLKIKIKLYDQDKILNLWRIATKWRLIIYLWLLNHVDERSLWIDLFVQKEVNLYPLWIDLFVQKKSKSIPKYTSLLH